MKEQQSSFDILRNLSSKKNSLLKLSFWNFSRHDGIKKENLKNIKKIDIIVHPHQKKDISDNIIGDYVEAEFINGKKSRIYEVWLQNNPMVLQKSTGNYSPAVRDIPDVAGVGKLPPLQDAVDQDKSGNLAFLVRSYLHEKNAVKRLNLLNQIIYAWANVADVPLQSRTSEQGWNYIGDARKLAALEVMLNQPYQGYLESL